MLTGIASVITIFSFLFAVGVISIAVYFNIKTIQINRLNKFTDYIHEFNKTIIEHPELGNLSNNEIEINNGNKDYINKIKAFICMRLNAFENIWYQFISKKLPHKQNICVRFIKFIYKHLYYDEVLREIREKEAWECYIKSVFEIKLTRELLTEGNLYNKDFVKYIDDLLKS